MRAELLRVGADPWAELLASTPHDFYHLPGYVALSAEHAGGEPVGLHVRDGTRSMLLPLILQPVTGGGWDATSPYGYPGPITRGAEDPDFLRDALKEGCRTLANEGGIALFVRFHPLLNRVIPEGPWTVVRHGETVTVDLALTPEELWRQTRHGHRSQISRSQRQGHRVVFDEGWTHVEAFERLYRQTMDRLSADPYYFFDAQYLSSLREALGDRLHLVIVEIGDEVAAAGLFAETSGIVQYHLSGSDERHARAGPSKLMLHEVRTWAKQRGDRWFHLGGGLGAASDSLIEFKAGFSPLRLPFHTLRAVLREAEYATLVTRRVGGVDPGDLTGYFPAYRQPTRDVGAGDGATRPT